MRLLPKNGVPTRAIAYRNINDEPVVRLRCGQLWYELLSGEAADLARQLLAAARLVDSGEVPVRTVSDTPHRL